MGLFNLFKKKKPIITMSYKEYTPSELAQERAAELEENVRRIQELQKYSYPSKNGLLPHEIAVLCSASHYKNAGNKFPQYWYYDYGINDVQQVLDMLFDKGFICISDVKDRVAKLKVDELKALLSEFDIPAKGKKADLVKAVQENISEDILSERFPVRYYSLTELGEQEIKSNEYISYLGAFGRYDLTIWDMNARLHATPSVRFQDIIWGDLNKRNYDAISQLSQTGDFYEYYLHRIRICRQMSDFLIEENRNYEQALDLLSESLFYDMKIKAAYSFHNFIKDATNKDDIIPFKDWFDLKYKIKGYRDIQNTQEITDSEISAFITSAVSRLHIRYDSMGWHKIPKLTISDEEFSDLVIAEINENENAADKIYQKIEKEIEAQKNL